MVLASVCRAANPNESIWASPCRIPSPRREYCPARWSNDPPCRFRYFSIASTCHGLRGLYNWERKLPSLLSSAEKRASVESSPFRPGIKISMSKPALLWMMLLVIESFPRQITRAHGGTQVSSIRHCIELSNYFSFVSAAYTLRYNLLAVNDASKRHVKTRHEVKTSRVRVFAPQGRSILFPAAEEADLWHKAISIRYSWNYGRKPFFRCKALWG